MVGTGWIEASWTTWLRITLGRAAKPMVAGSMPARSMMVQSIVVQADFEALT